MLKEVLASNAAKLVAACVCPVVAGAVAVQVPAVRSAVHKATAPKPQRTARAKPRVRVPEGQIAQAMPPLAAAPLCPGAPVVLSEPALKPASLDTALSLPTPDLTTRFDDGARASNCAPVSFTGGRLILGTGAVPEPATWAQMLAGFAFAGGALRRRRRNACHVAVTSFS